MCCIPKNIISVELSFYPLKTQNINECVNQVLNIIEKSGVDHHVSNMSTQIIGDTITVYTLLQQISDYNAEQEIKYSMHASISNLCGVTCQTDESCNMTLF